MSDAFSKNHLLPLRWLRPRGGAAHAGRLRHYLTIGPHGWLSLGDRSRLSEVVCPDDWKVSAGLFVPTDKAWLVIRQFCESGTRSNDIEWITPDDMPDDGNY